MAAFGRLVTRYQDRVVNTCWRVCGSRDDAEDLAQDALLKALAAIGSFQKRASFFTWLYRIAVNVAIAHRRKLARAPRRSLHGPQGELLADRQSGRADSEDPSAPLSARETERKLLAGLDELDDDHRAVIVLRDLEGLDYQQMAEVLELPVGTVKSRLHRARMELKMRLKDEVA